MCLKKKQQQPLCKIWIWYFKQKEWLRCVESRGVHMVTVIRQKQRWMSAPPPPTPCAVQCAVCCAGLRCLSLSAECNTMAVVVGWCNHCCHTQQGLLRWPILVLATEETGASCSERKFQVQVWFVFLVFCSQLRSFHAHIVNSVSHRATSLATVT